MVEKSHGHHHGSSILRRQNSNDFSPFSLDMVTHCTYVSPRCHTIYIYCQSRLILPCAPLFLYHGALTYLAKLFTHKSEEGFYRFCSKRQKFCSFARHTLTINTTPIPSIAMHISSLLDPFHVQFKFLSTPKYHYSQKCPELHMEWVQQ